MKVAVTAGSGTLGSTVIRHLIPVIGKENILAIARNADKAKNLGVKVQKGDYNNKEDFLAALPGMDVVLIVSGMDTPENRIAQHRNIIQASIETGVRKIVYTSIAGESGNSTFDPIVLANRQTEKDIQESGLEWSIGRNGLYIEPDIEFIDEYKKEGKIANCAGDGLCSYTTRDELAAAYAQMILNDEPNGKVFNLAGEAISQQQLCGYLNRAFDTDLVYEDLGPEAYLEFQLEHNGAYLGPIIAGIYRKIRAGEFHMQSDFDAAAGRPHISWEVYFNSLKYQV
jgi:NAD(P)H dehydrogenase (quinone)